MKRIKVSFDTWIQLLGMIGVLGGLIFVGLEMRQSQMIALAAQSQARASMLIERVGVYTEANLDFQSLLFESSYDTDLSRSEAAQRNTFHQSWYLSIRLPLLRRRRRLSPARPQGRGARGAQKKCATGGAARREMTPQEAPEDAK